MQAQQYLVGLWLKVSFVLQTRLARFVIAGIALMLVVAFVLYLAGYAHITTILLSHVTGHAQATTSVGQQLVGSGDPWPIAPH